MKETEEIMGMIKEEGAAYFARERGNKVEVGLYLAASLVDQFLLSFGFLLRM